jgi:hypothetical protein
MAKLPVVQLGWFSPPALLRLVGGGESLFLSLARRAEALCQSIDIGLVLLLQVVDQAIERRNLVLVNHD